MNAVGEKLMDKVAATGAAITGTAWAANWIQIIDGVGQILLTYAGLATAVLTSLYYLTKFLDWLEQRKQRNAKIQSTVEDETSDL